MFDSPKPQKTFLLFVPDILQISNGGYLYGTSKSTPDYEAFYVTKPNLNSKQSDGDFIGYIAANNQNYTKKFKKQCSNFVKIVYNYHTFSNYEFDTGIPHDYGDHIEKLHREIYRRKPRQIHFKWLLNLLTQILATILAFCAKFKTILFYSATISHFYNNLTDWHWFLTQLRTEKRPSPKLLNLVVSKLFDIALGIFLFQWLVANEDFIVELLDNGREIIVENFRNLLTYLMGSPIGLKLNHAFNRTLGTFFFYHISLWKIFLKAMHPFIQHYFRFFILPGVYGFSYHIAMISDVLSIATFHLYCIYVYAARLTSLQLRGLLSLWKLFIGRKNNPLRQRIDSFNYSPNQLFIGTLAFTVFLFLMPTTLMYYTVFVCLRIVILLTGQIMKSVCNLLHSIPFYILFLWLVQSPQLLGSIQFTHTGQNTFRADFNNLGLVQCIKHFTYSQSKRKDENKSKPLLCNVFSGALI